MQMYDSANLGLGFLRSMQRVIDRKKMALRQLVHPLNQNRLAAMYFKCRTGAHALVSPKRRRRHLAVYFLRKLSH
jgi:hypothetical protein